MSKKHGKVLARLRRQLEKMSVAFALAEDHVEELQTLHDEDTMAIEYPNSPVKKKKSKPRVM